MVRRSLEDNRVVIRVIMTTIYKFKRRQNPEGFYFRNFGVITSELSGLVHCAHRFMNESKNCNKRRKGGFVPIVVRDITAQWYYC